MGDFTVKVAHVKDKQKIYDLNVRAFFPDMPLFAALGVTLPLGFDEWPSLQTLDQKLTFIAVSTEGEIMGFAINVVPRKGEFVPIPGKLKTFFEFVDEDSEGLLSKLEKSTMEQRVMCVDKKWRGLGVSKRLLVESENLAKSLGYKSIFSMATSAYMEAAHKSRGWKCVYRLNYKDYAERDKNFTVPQEPHTSLTLYEKVFDDN